MNGTLRLILFDVDGTLVDSQDDIVGSMTLSFEALGLTSPKRSEIVDIIGLSLETAVIRLMPGLAEPLYENLVIGYKAAYKGLRAHNGTTLSSPLYPNARVVLQSLWAKSDYLLGVATGKSRRGLDILLEEHGLSDYFLTVQCADLHPSKPHPAMLQAALAETGVEAKNAVMIGDTQFDMEMAGAAGLHAIGVTWGYHDVQRLGRADHIANDFAQIPLILKTLWQDAA